MRNERIAGRIIRDTQGSTIDAWDINQDSITENDRRHAKVAEYLQHADAAIEREVASALRPMLEAFVRVAYPADFPPGYLLGPFADKCRQRQGGSTEILNTGDVAELRDLLDYANTFHHDSNAAYATVQINDQELKRFCERILAFVRRK